jgi:sarcosine/dimethylglycine N-methyltransferase
VLDRLHLDTLGSIAYYREQAARRGWSEINVHDLTPQLVAHYSRVRSNLGERRRELAGRISEAYFDRMIQGLGHWIDAGSKGYLAWGILHFTK